MKLLGFIIALSLLSGCGFKPAVTWSQLDGPVELVSAEPYSQIQRALTQLVNQSLAEYDQLPSVQGVRQIELKELQKTTTVISVDSNGRPAEYRLELVQNVTFMISEQEYQQSFRQSRDYVFDVRDILAYQRQVKQLETTMSEQIAQKILYAFSARLKG